MTKKIIKEKTDDMTKDLGFEELSEYEEILEDFHHILITAKNVLKLFPKISKEYAKQEEKKYCKISQNYDS